MKDDDQADTGADSIPAETGSDSTNVVSRSGGVDINANSVNVGQDVVGRDKIIQNIYVHLGLSVDEVLQTPPRLSSSQKYRLQQRMDELQTPLNIYDQRVQALAEDIALALDGEQRIVLKERLEQVKQARKDIEMEIEEIERLLGVGDEDSSP